MSELKGDFGFIGILLNCNMTNVSGLGMMGYPMAINIRKKIPSSSKLYIFDVSKAALDRFKDETSSYGEVVIASSSKDVADHAVHLDFSVVDLRIPLSPCCPKAHM